MLALVTTLEGIRRPYVGGRSTIGTGNLIRYSVRRPRMHGDKSFVAKICDREENKDESKLVGEPTIKETLGVQKSNAYPKRILKRDPSVEYVLVHVGLRLLSSEPSDNPTRPAIFNGILQLHTDPRFHNSTPGRNLLLDMTILHMLPNHVSCKLPSRPRMSSTFSLPDPALAIHASTH